MDITITIRGLEELGLGLSALAAALPETARVLATMQNSAPQPNTAAPVAPKAELEAQTATTPAPEAGNADSVPAVPVHTREEVRTVLARKAAEGHSAEIQALLIRYGAHKLSELAPEHFDDLLSDAEVL